MDQLFCLNIKSFPASDEKNAKILFEDAIQGLLSLNTGSDRFILYFDSNGEKLYDFELADGFTYSQYLEYLESIQEYDLLHFLYEIEDKSPALDFFTDEDLDSLGHYQFYIPNLPTDKKDDSFGIAWSLGATLLSITSDEVWNNHKIKIARTSDGQYNNEVLKLYNIASLSHGKFLFEQRNKTNLNDIFENQHQISVELINWFETLSKENKHRVIDKFNLAHEKKFKGGEPLFKSLKNSDGLKEIRIPAYPSGAIRVLFKALYENKQAILVGFIKKSDREGYGENIKRANKIFNEIPDS